MTRIFLARVAVLRRSWAWYERLESFARTRPVATALAVGALTNPWTRGTLAGSLASLASLLPTLGSLVGALFIDSGLVGAAAQWLAIHTVAYAAALATGLPWLWAASQYRDSRRISILFAILGLLTMLLARGVGAVWALEVVVGVPRWAALVYVTTSFVLSMTLRMREARRRARRSVVPVIPADWLDIATPLFRAAQPREWTYIEMAASDPRIVGAAKEHGVPEIYVHSLRQSAYDQVKSKAVYLLLNDDPAFATNISYLSPGDRTSLSQPAWDARYKREFKRQNVPHRVIGSVSVAGWEHDIHEVRIVPELVCFQVHIVDPRSRGFALLLTQRDAAPNKLDVFKSFLGTISFAK